MNFHKNNPEPTQIIQLLNSPAGQKKKPIFPAKMPKPTTKKFEIRVDHAILQHPRWKIFIFQD